MGRARRNWTPEEDAQLRRMVNDALTNDRPLLWREFAKHMNGRSNKDCRKRWWNSLTDSTAKGPWSEEEDEKLFEAVRLHGTNWNQVATVVGSRHADQCSSHWNQVLDPDINYCDWTAQENDVLLYEVAMYGTNWSTITASHEPKRTSLALKNRYFTLQLQMKNKNSTHGSSASLSSSLSSTASSTKAKLHSRKESTTTVGSPGDTGSISDKPMLFDERDDSRTAGITPKAINARDIPVPLHPTALHDQTLSMPLEMWTGFEDQSDLFSRDPLLTPPPSNDYWMNEATDYSAYTSAFSSYNNSPPIFSHDHFLDSGKDAAGAELDMTLLDSSMDTSDDFFPNTNPSSVAESRRDAASGDDGATEGSCGLDMGTSRAKKFSVSSNGKPDSPMHQVSIDMLCTPNQLKDVMAWLVGAELGVNVKIDRE